MALIYTFHLLTFPTKGSLFAYDVMYHPKTHAYHICQEFSFDFCTYVNSYTVTLQRTTLLSRRRMNLCILGFA